MKSFPKPSVLVINVLLASLWGVFLMRHLKVFIESSSISLLLFIIMESVVILLFLLRRTPVSVSRIPVDWVAATIGTFVGLLYIPTGEGISASFGGLLVSIGALIAILSYVSLRRSFGLIAANRGIKQSGLYKIVRHPMYTSYIVLYGGYVLMNTSILNLTIFGIAIIAIAFRISGEEKHLMLDPVYVNYVKKCKWRLFPYIF